ncbi:hypothetical protein DPMN_179674 [Dreissena polymorpha]|uniref:Uncharacterized protein n=1 Tax=Dreissena polymorpha TaxID=45954 RepID=A0A9D4IKZ6_DREPO|nr:hypothetical protein DPMN_179674 [Dreissena polymorpha]
MPQMRIHRKELSGATSRFLTTSHFSSKPDTWNRKQCPKDQRTCMTSNTES